MDPIKLNIFRAKKTAYEEKADKERKSAIRKIEDEQKAIVALFKSKGWKYLNEYAEANVNFLKENLVKSDDINARAEIRAWRKIINYVQNIVNQVG